MHANGRRRSGEILTALAAYAGAVVLCVAILVGVMKLWRADLTVPFSYSADSLLVQMWIKGLVDNPWYLHNDYLGMPAGLDMHDFPASDGFLFLLLKLLALAIPNHAVVCNLYFLLTFPLSTVSALFVLRRLQISYAPAVVAALLFTFLPYHFLRGQHHLFLASYFLIPPMVLVILRVYLGRRLGESAGARGIWPRLRPLATLGFCLVFASAGVYYAVFACFFLLVAGVVACCHRRRIAPLGTAGILIAALGLGLVANGVPTLLYRWQHGPNDEAVARLPCEAEIYGLKVAQLVLPVMGHRLDWLARLRAHYDSQPVIFLNENGLASLGLVAGAGFLLLMGRLLYRKPRPSPRVQDGLSVLNAAAVLLATTGGLSSLFAILGATWIRAYNRISVYIAFFALAAVALLLERAARRLKPSVPGRLLFYGGLGAILIAGVLDETTKDFAPPYALREREYAHDAEFVHRIEASVPANAMIFQLPYVPFVEEPPLNQMRCFDHGRPYLHSRTLRWSYAAMRGRGCALWQAEVAGQEPAEMIEALSVAGFEGIYVDRNGFADRGSELESELSRLLGVAPLESGNRQQSFFNMTGYNQKFRQQYSDPQWAALREASLRALQETSASAMGQTPYPTTGDSSAATSGAVTVLRTRIDRAARQVHLKVRLQNLGGTAWPPYTPPTPGGVTLALRQGSPGAPGFREAVPRFPLPRALLPGKERVFEVAFTLPEDSRPEPWYLDLVSEGVFWFSTRGSVPAEVRLTDQGSGRPEQSP